MPEQPLFPIKPLVLKSGSKGAACLARRAGEQNGALQLGRSYRAVDFGAATIRPLSGVSPEARGATLAPPLVIRSGPSLSAILEALQAPPCRPRRTDEIQSARGRSRR